MRLIRSFFFGARAMLAAVVFLSAPARAVDYEPGLSISLEWPEIAVSFIKVPEVTFAEREKVPTPTTDGHAVAYASQNQPLASLRFAADTYLRIDPHIRAG